MKRIISFLVCILLGIGIGWYFGYTRPAAKNQRELLKQYHLVRDGLGLTDADWAEMAKELPHMREDMQRSDEYAAAIALAAFKNLEADNTEEARWKLAMVVGIYYRSHSRDGNTNLLSRIVRYAATNTMLSNTVYGKVDSITMTNNSLQPTATALSVSTNK
jgi:hypothetical protein